MATTVHEPPKIEAASSTRVRKWRLAESGSGGRRPARGSGLLPAAGEHGHLGSGLCHQHDICGADQRLDRAQGLFAGLAKLHAALDPLFRYCAASGQQRHAGNSPPAGGQVHGRRRDSRGKSGALALHHSGLRFALRDRPVRGLGPASGTKGFISPPIPAVPSSTCSRSPMCCTCWEGWPGWLM